MYHFGAITALAECGKASQWIQVVQYLRYLRGSKSGSNRPVPFGAATRNACPQMGERKYNTF